MQNTRELGLDGAIPHVKALLLLPPVKQPLTHESTAIAFSMVFFEQQRPLLCM